MTELLFLEKTFWYKNILEQPYQKDTHIPGKDMARLVELKIVLGRNFNVNLFPSWSEWIANASEHELIDVTIAMMNRDDFCILILFKGVHVRNRQDERYDYLHLLKQLKENADKIIIHENHVYDFKKFTECRVSRVENVLTKLHEMKLLK